MKNISTNIIDFNNLIKCIFGFEWIVLLYFLVCSIEIDLKMIGYSMFYIMFIYIDDIKYYYEIQF